MQLKILGCFGLLFIACNAYAQVYIGVTGDFGNRVVATPKPDDQLLKSPIAVSGSVVFLKQDELKNDWILQYGADLGLLGYIIKYQTDFDTLHTYPDGKVYFSEFQYYIFHINARLAIGKQFSIAGKNARCLIGAGGTYQWHGFLESSSTFSICDDASCATETKVFEYNLNQRNNNIKFFADASLQTNLTKGLMIGLKYRYHFSDCLEGSYNFYHTKSANTGSLSLAQRTLSIEFLFRLGKQL